MPTDTINHPDTIRTAVRERYGSLARKDDESAQEEGLLRREGSRRLPGRAAAAR